MSDQTRLFLVYIPMIVLIVFGPLLNSNTVKLYVGIYFFIHGILGLITKKFFNYIRYRKIVNPMRKPYVEGLPAIVASTIYICLGLLFVTLFFI